MRADPAGVMSRVLVCGPSLEKNKRCALREDVRWCIAAFHRSRANSGERSLASSGVRAGGLGR
eukprot:88510-Prymnesium_polylepis.1